ncbi:Stf0 family sulfotransferase [Nitratireductor thuwali]|uniref:Stf0 family sulfotransferase n=1 Tax=Nitratireductor thuwali TaxID=2267699 RepID=UPI0030D51BEA
MDSYRSYIICTTSRSGSTLLCKLLSQTGVAGEPNSYFHRPSVSSWASKFDLPRGASATQEEFLQAVVKATRERGSAGTGVFGLRLMRKSFDFLMEQLDILCPGLANDAERFEMAFGRTLYIHLTRSDKVAQAVSLIKASQTGLWHLASDGSELERTAPPRPPSYNAGEIARNVAELTAHDEEWVRWFERERIDPVLVGYDVLSDDPKGTVAGILNRLGLDAAAAREISPGVAKLADETSRAWIERYRAEGAQGRTD